MSQTKNEAWKYESRVNKCDRFFCTFCFTVTQTSKFLPIKRMAGHIFATRSREEPSLGKRDIRKAKKRLYPFQGISSTFKALEKVSLQQHGTVTHTALAALRSIGSGRLPLSSRHCGQGRSIGRYVKNRKDNHVNTNTTKSLSDMLVLFLCTHQSQSTNDNVDSNKFQVQNLQVCGNSWARRSIMPAIIDISMDT